MQLHAVALVQWQPQKRPTSQTTNSSFWMHRRMRWTLMDQYSRNERIECVAVRRHLVTRRQTSPGPQVLHWRRVLSELPGSLKHIQWSLRIRMHSAPNTKKRTPIPGRLLVSCVMFTSSTSQRLKSARIVLAHQRFKCDGNHATVPQREGWWAPIDKKKVFVN